MSKTPLRKVMDAISITHKKHTAFMSAYNRVQAIADREITLLINAIEKEKISGTKADKQIAAIDKRMLSMYGKIEKDGPLP